MDKLTELLLAEGTLHTVLLKRIARKKHKGKIAAAAYQYQVDCDGEWGEILVDFENRTAEIICLADWDTVKTNCFANNVMTYLLDFGNKNLPKGTIVPI